MKANLGKLPLWVFAASVIALLALMLRPAAQGTATQEEQRIAEALSAMAGAGRVKVVLYYAQQETNAFSSAAVPTGALVVAEGAGDMGVRLNLIRAVRTLLGLPETAVDVFAMEGAP